MDWARRLVMATWARGRGGAARGQGFPVFELENVRLAVGLGAVGAAMRNGRVWVLARLRRVHVTATGHIGGVTSIVGRNVFIAVGFMGFGQCQCGQELGELGESGLAHCGHG